VIPAELLVAVAGHGLHPSTRKFNARPLPAAMWRAVAAGLEAHGLGALALAAAGDGALPVTDAQEAEVRRLSDAAASRVRTAVDCLDAVVSTLDRSSIDTRVLHGASISALDYPIRGLRPFDSVDVLVAPVHHDAAVSLLQSAGVLSAPPALGRGRRRRDVRHVASNGVVVCLHASLTPGRVGEVVETPSLLASRTRFTLGATDLCAVGAEERLLAACIRGREAGLDLLAQRDVVQLVLRDDLSAKRVERLASSWRAEAVLADAVRRSWQTFSVPDVVPISAWSRAYRPHRRERRRLSVHEELLRPTVFDGLHIEGTTEHP
jgi:hypothetical protein